MPDMLVKLYDFSLDETLFQKFSQSGIQIRRALPPERSRVLDFVLKNFGTGWADECSSAFSRMPCTCFIAVKNNEILGFSCCEATAPDFFGPTGILSEHRGEKLGTALLQIALQELKNRGYAYAIIGGAGPTAFYEKTCNAQIIPNSVPGFYKNMLKI